MEDQEELTAEQAAHYEAMERFVCATENIRFKETRDNWAALMNFLTDQNLPVNTQNLRFAFLALSRANKLDLMALGQAAPPQPPQAESTPTPTAQPAPVVPAKARTVVVFRNGQRL